MVDVGCGVGGSSRHIARKFNAQAKGITLSPVQVIQTRMRKVQKHRMVFLPLGRVLHSISPVISELKTDCIAY